MLVAPGLSNSEIAQRMGVATCTVRKHLEHAYRKLGVTNRLAAAVALRGEMLPPSDLRDRLTVGTERSQKDSRKRECPQGDGRTKGRQYRQLHLGDPCTSSDARAPCSSTVCPHDRPARVSPVALPRRSRGRSCSPPDQARPPRPGRPGAGAAELGAHRLPHRVRRRRDARSRSACLSSGSPHWPCTGPSRRRSRRAGPPPSAPPSSRPAYQVLQHYYPKLRAKLAGRPGREPGEAVAPGPAKRYGVKIGKRAAPWRHRRAGRDDGYLDTTIHYSLAAGVGVWQPAPRRPTCSRAWLGSLRAPGDKKTSRSTVRTRSRARRTPPVRGGEEPGSRNSTDAHRARRRRPRCSSTPTRRPWSVTRWSATSRATRCGWPTRPGCSRRSTPR